MDFGEKLKALRTERGLTQEQLAARLYVSRTAVSKWETGGGSPNLDSLQAVARLFDVSVDDLLSADDLIVLARDERRSTARSSGMLSFGLLDVLAVVFAFIPLYGVDDGSFVRMANLADYGASVDFGASFAVMAAAVVSLMFVGAVEIVLAAAGSRRAARIVALVGFAVQALAVVLFRLHHAALRHHAHVRAAPGEGRRRLPYSALVTPGRLRRSRTVSPVRRIVACRREARVVSLRLGPARDPQHP